MSSSSQLDSPADSSTSSVWRFSLDDIYDYPTIDDRGYNLLAQIAGIYENGGRPDDSALLMDGTHIMMKKSLSEICRTTLLYPLPAAVPTNHGDTNTNIPKLTPPALVFQQCRNCSDSFIFNLRDGEVVTIISGIPKADAGPYKTLSYVWGPLPSNPLSIPCMNCSLITLVPMLSAQRFRNLMELGGSGNTIWLDALSIDQQDPSDIARCVAVMGHIYKNASCVSVLLPESDKTAYDTFKALELYATVILARRLNFLNNSEYEFTDPDTGARTKVLTSVCQDFIRNIVNLAKSLNKFAYFRRAWTFQEWALANDLEVAVEGDVEGAQGQDGPQSRTEGATCRNIKSLILGAAMLISRYKILQHQYVEINLGSGLSRGNIPPLFNIVKALFPDEDLFLSYEEVDPKKVNFQANFPHSGVDQLLGVRSLLPPTRGMTQAGTDISSTGQDAEGPHLIPPRSNPQLQIRARLTLLLSVFASSKREAKYEADLVACWASMCNIKYAYNPHDTFLVALRKVKTALRQAGITIYDFLPDTKTVEGPTRNDAEIFLLYAKEHSQLNATNGAEFPGAPIFTGRADTVSHMLHSVKRIKIPTEWNDTLGDEEVSHGFTMISGATIDDVIALDGDLTAAMNTFAQKAVYGDMIPLQGFMFWSVQDVAKMHLEKIPSETRLKGRIVIVKIPFHKHSEANSGLQLSLHVWGIVPTDIAIEDTKICREPVNGALTLVVEKGGAQRIISYLVISDHLSGTFLIHTSSEGQIDLTITIPERGDSMSSHHKQIAERKLTGEVKLIHTL